MHPPFRFPGKSWFALVPLALASGIYLSSQIVPDAPVEDFRVSMFNDPGYKIWFLKGDYAALQEEGKIDMKGLDLEVYTGEEPNQLDFRIEGDNATYLSHDKSLFGDQGVKLVSQAFTIEGEQWRYDQLARRIQVSENVRVVLNYEMEPFFK